MNSGIVGILDHIDSSKEDLAEILNHALEGRRRVKEQLKKMGAFEYYHTSFSFLDIESGDELKTFQFDAGSACWMGADGELLLICRTDSQSAPAQSTSVRLIELASGRELAHVDPRELGIRGYLRNWSSASKRGVFYHFPGKRGRADGPEAVIVDLKTGLEIHRLKLEQSQSVLDFSPDGRLLLVSRGAWHLQLFQVAPPD